MVSVNINRYEVIAIDFDGTIVEHEYPAIGSPVNGAIDVMRRMQKVGKKLILWTMRSGKELEEAVNYCKSHGVTFWGINKNPDQHWSASPKAYAQLYIDDAAFGCPLINDPYAKRPYVDWGYIHTMLFDEGMK